jgi:hypothetical protein
MTGVADLPQHERPLSEQFRIVARAYVDADGAARMLAEMKTTTLEQKKNALIAADPKLADNAAERQVKASPEWAEYIKAMVDAKTKANLLEYKLEYIRMRSIERNSINATAREEMRMGGR